MTRAHLGVWVKGPITLLNDETGETIGPTEGSPVEQSRIIARRVGHVELAVCEDDPDRVHVTWEHNDEFPKCWGKAALAHFFHALQVHFERETEAETP